MAKEKAHVSEAKKQVVKDLAKDLKEYKSILVTSIKSLPAAQFQEIKKQLRAQAKILVAKKSLIDFALEHAENPSLRELEKYIGADCALMFSNEDPFILSGMLADSKTPAKAKEGQVPEEDIYAEAGLTELVPGPDISALSGVGIQTKVENGKLSILKKTLLCKKGEPINAARVSVLGKLGIMPFKNGVEPVAAYSEGKVYADIKIDKKATLEELEYLYSRAFAFAVELAWMNSETMPFVLGKAAAHENALKSLIKEDTPVEEKKEEPKAEEVKEEASAEETKSESTESADQTQ